MEAILPDTETQNSSCLPFTQAQLCRLCLNQSSNCILIYSDNIATLVTYLPVYVTESDNALLSPWVCIFCVDKMRMVMEFFRMILDSYKTVLADDAEAHFKSFFTKPDEPPEENMDDFKPNVAELCETIVKDDNENASEESDDNDIENNEYGDNIENEESLTKIEVSHEERVKYDCVDLDLINNHGLKLHERVKLAGSKHYLKILDLNTFRTCANCGVRLNSFSCYENHWKKAHVEHEFKIKCIEEEESCQFISKRSEDMKAHIREHMLTLGHMERCVYCNKPYTSHRMKSHIKTHDTTFSWKCDICGKMIKNRLTMLSHKRSHETKWLKYPCEDCGKVFKTNASLKIHIKSVHLNIRDFPCDICGKMFSTLGKKQTHELTHAETKDFLCDRCDASFKNPRTLQTHIKKVHEQIFDFPCHLCPSKYTSRNLLEEHLRIHTGERPFKCAVCGKGFTKKHTLTVHERIHLPAEQKYRFPCNMCDKKFPEKGNLMTHMRLVHKVENGYRDPNNYKKD